MNGQAPITVQLRGLSVYAYHGANSEEQSLGQQFEFDLDLDIADCPACSSDALNDAVDYAAVTSLVVEVATSFRFNLLEALAEAVCLELLAEFPLERVCLHVRKLAPPIPHRVASAGIRIERTRTHLMLSERDSARTSSTLDHGQRI